MFCLQVMVAMKTLIARVFISFLNRELRYSPNSAGKPWCPREIVVCEQSYSCTVSEIRKTKSAPRSGLILQLFVKGTPRQWLSWRAYHSLTPPIHPSFLVFIRPSKPEGFDNYLLLKKPFFFLRFSRLAPESSSTASSSSRKGSETVWLMDSGEQHPP